MKNISIAIAFLFSLSFFSCRSSNPVEHSLQAAASSKIAVSLLMKGAPQEVTKIVGILSRTGYDTLQSQFVIGSDTASCEFSSIAVGVWHIQVNAYDNSNTMLYSGAADVQVYAGIVTPVNLSLDPVTGSVIVTVTWGTSLTSSQYALLFGSDGSLVAIPPASLFHLQVFTVEMDVQINNTDTTMVPLLCETNLNQWNRADGFSVKWERGYLYLRVAVDSTYSNAVAKPYSFKQGQWVHIAGTYDHQTLRIYVNGNLFVSMPYTSNIYYGSNGFNFGSAYHSLYGGMHYLHGMMDEIRIWNYARTPAQIQQTMKQVLQGNETGLVGYWNCERTTSTTILYDQTDYNHNGTMTGNVSFVLSNAFSQ
jgi:Concanavalin A-like lectin/glucanases superfamily